MGAYDEKPWLARYTPGQPADIDVEYADVLSLFRATVERTPDGDAIRYFDGRITFRELDQLTDAFAAAVIALGFSRGDRVALYLQNVPQFVIAQIGTWKAGGIAASINPMNRARELEQLHSPTRRPSDCAHSSATDDLASSSPPTPTARDSAPPTAYSGSSPSTAKTRATSPSRSAKTPPNCSSQQAPPPCARPSPPPPVWPLRSSTPALASTPTGWTPSKARCTALAAPPKSSPPSRSPAGRRTSPTWSPVPASRPRSHCPKSSTLPRQGRWIPACGHVLEEPIDRSNRSPTWELTPTSR